MITNKDKEMRKTLITKKGKKMITVVEWQKNEKQAIFL